LLIFSSIILTIIGFFIVPIIVPTIFPKYTDAIEPIKIMSFSIIPMSISKIYTSKFLSMEKSKVIFIGSVTSTVILIPTMIAFGIWFDISGIAASFVLATVIQASYYYLASKKLNKGENTVI
jgi:O-antigen/teichoic acid export membrane protein